jgi:hypothetical protein
MKVLVLLGVLILTGCISAPTLEQLETQAFLTGDWSAVERRQRTIAKRAALRTIQCPAGYIAVCKKQIGEDRCGCINDAQMRALLSWH